MTAQKTHLLTFQCILRTVLSKSTELSVWLFCDRNRVLNTNRYICMLVHNFDLQYKCWEAGAELFWLLYLKKINKQLLTNIVTKIIGQFEFLKSEVGNEIPNFDF